MRNMFSLFVVIYIGTYVYIVYICTYIRLCKIWSVGIILDGYIIAYEISFFMMLRDIVSYCIVTHIGCGDCLLPICTYYGLLPII